ncbi:hypothetical protein [Sphingomonas sp. TX0522]|uniref:hypothetical protein n=1 Tax=Sphingomonas sp. TX0522 TaxID=2479205 RepID=UPI0018DF9212|nr:hypothetical protein [Sphingomonas sp. TX0522]MBI0530095.1 hypothetical protein [Sphingomonas sp. TX0522]
MTDRISYTLKHPIHWTEGDERKTLTVLDLAARVKGRHMKAVDKANGPVEAKLLLIAALAGLPRVIADDLDEQDVLAIDALYAGDTSDLAQIAAELELPDDAGLPVVLSAIGALKRRSLAVPLDGGAGQSTAGPAIGSPS